MGDNINLSIPHYEISSGKGIFKVSLTVNESIIDNQNLDFVFLNVTINGKEMPFLKLFLFEEHEDLSLVAIVAPGTEKEHTVTTVQKK